MLLCVCLQPEFPSRQEHKFQEARQEKQRSTMQQHRVRRRCLDDPTSIARGAHEAPSALKGGTARQPGEDGPKMGTPHPASVSGARLSRPYARGAGVSVNGVT